ncbi:MAG: inorganic pyrophosphatase [Anaerolineae bacterium]|nr:inorganic pyrophosphatase [Anaerolineae bacterium]
MNEAPANLDFWAALDHLIASSEVVIDRPKGTAHPRMPHVIYPIAYGYLAGTSSGDGDGVDVWLGAEPARRLVAVVCTVDLTKRDTELKLLLGCTPDEMQTILAWHNTGGMSGILIPRPADV